MIEKPIDRLNYFNGQRLEATDFKTEQDYHIRVRRWLNKSLYSAGIARGLEVHATTTIAEGGSNPCPAVVVSPGLALDAQGREIILWEEETVPVMGHANSLYLTIRYSEEVTGTAQNGCEALSGPMRVRAQPRFEWRDFLPTESSGEVILALVQLTPDCSQVAYVDASVRRYVGAGSAAKVKQYALEGEREVAAIPVPGQAKPLEIKARVYFHIRGRQPNAVTLILRGDTLSPLHYTELGRHDHAATIAVKFGDHTLDSGNSSHQHDLASYYDAVNNRDVPNLAEYEYDETIPDPDIANRYTRSHTHWLEGRTGAATTEGDIGIDKPYAFGVVHSDIGPHRISGPNHVTRTVPGLGAIQDPQNVSIEGGKHRHQLGGKARAGSLNTKLSHTGLDTSGSTVGFRGAENGPVSRVGNVLTFLRSLDISIDGRPMTTAILSQIQTILPTADRQAWASMGDGTSNSPFVVKGTGPIRLDFLPDMRFAEDEHYIEFSVQLGVNGEANGGKVIYNLYVE